MCGISGIILKEKAGFHLPACLEEMNTIIRHRGPDDEGFLLFENNTFITAGGDSTPEKVFNAPEPEWMPRQHIKAAKYPYLFGFGHRRLSILDLSPAGHQPMCIQEKNFWITFNGEIYNYLELRIELVKEGFSFKTETDTEVILNAYLHWGFDCVNHFNGMWAFVIYDHGKGVFFGSRDRTGVKPFYYYNDPKVFAFSSEQKALVKMPFVKTGINAPAVFDFFIKNEIEYEEEGMFKNIFELPPAHSFIFERANGDFKKWRYFEVSAFNDYEDFDPVREKYFSEELSGLIQNAVKLRLRSDVPVGSCLSGGIDSSAITGIIQQQGLNYPLEVFTASFKEKEIDESHWAEEIAKRPNTHWNRTFPNASELLDDLQELAWCQDIPIWSTSTYAQFRVMRLAKEHNIKVVMSGQGGDELFAGYPAYLISWWKELFCQQNYQLLKHEMAGFESLSFSSKFFLKEYLKTSGLKKLPNALHALLLKKYHHEHQFLNPYFIRENSHRLNLERISSYSTLNEALKADLENQLLKKFLKCEDRCSMIHSVESRIPFSDDLPMINFAMRLPSSYKIRNGFQKHILRIAVKDFVPDKIAWRKDKMGYVTPNNSWITAIHPKIRDIFSNPLLKDYIDVENIDALFSFRKRGEQSMVFKFISFALWINLFEKELRK